MADKKISALTGATTPLAGTEVLPIVQGGTTVKVSVDNLTAGKLVTASAVQLGDIGATDATFQGRIKLEDGAVSLQNGGGLEFVTASFGSGYGWKINSIDSAGAQLLFGYRQNSVDWTESMRLTSDGNLKISTAGKGIDFSANGGDVLTQYDEGTWTPNQGAGLTVVGAFSSTGTFTRIGRQVTVQGRVVGATSIACSAFGVISSNLPFSSGGTTFVGSLFGGSPAAGGTTVTSAGIVYSVNAVSAGGDITFTITYFI